MAPFFFFFFTIRDPNVLKLKPPPSSLVTSAVSACIGPLENLCLLAWVETPLYPEGITSFAALLSILPQPTPPGWRVGIARSSFPGAESEHSCKNGCSLKCWCRWRPLAAGTLPLLPWELCLLTHIIPSHLNSAIFLEDVRVPTDDPVRTLASQFLNLPCHLQRLLLCHTVDFVICQNSPLFTVPSHSSLVCLLT